MPVILLSFSHWFYVPPLTLSFLLIREFWFLVFSRGTVISRVLVKMPQVKEEFLFPLLRQKTSSGLIQQKGLHVGWRKKREKADESPHCGSASFQDYMESQLIIINMLNTFCTPCYILMIKQEILSLAAMNKVWKNIHNYSKTAGLKRWRYEFLRRKKMRIGKEINKQF